MTPPKKPTPPAPPAVTAQMIRDLAWDEILCREHAKRRQRAELAEAVARLAVGAAWSCIVVGFLAYMIARRLDR